MSTKYTKHNSETEVINYVRLRSVWNGRRYLKQCNYDICETIKMLEKSDKSMISQSGAEDEIAKAKKYGAEIITITAGAYPLELKKIENPPLVLYAKGNVELLNKPIFAIVGSRLATADSLKMAYNTAKFVSNFGFTVTSGFAFGVDTAACKGAIETGTIQVFGSGVDVVYPKENTRLYDEVLKNNGLIISELKMESGPHAKNFPSRNRIISGLSKGVLLVQAGMRNGSSGSLLTAQMALEQNKYLFAIPGNPMDPRFDGCNELIKSGDAIFTTKPEDITDMIGYMCKPNYIEKEKIRKMSANAVKNSLEQELFESFGEESMKNDVGVDLDLTEEESNLESKIMSLISSNPISISEISEILGREIQDINVCISNLELNGVIDRQHDGKIIKS